MDGGLLGASGETLGLERVEPPQYRVAPRAAPEIALPPRHESALVNYSCKKRQIPRRARASRRRRSVSIALTPVYDSAAREPNHGDDRAITESNWDGGRS